MIALLEQLTREEHAAETEATAKRERAEAAYRELVLACADDSKIDQTRAVTILADAGRKPTQLAADVRAELERRQLVVELGANANGSDGLDELRAIKVDLAERQRLKALIDSEAALAARLAEAQGSLDAEHAKIEQARIAFEAARLAVPAAVKAAQDAGTVFQRVKAEIDAKLTEARTARAALIQRVPEARAYDSTIRAAADKLRTARETLATIEREFQNLLHVTANAEQWVVDVDRVIEHITPHASTSVENGAILSRAKAQKEKSARMHATHAANTAEQRGVIESIEAEIARLTAEQFAAAIAGL